nr:MAG TPA: hypothetical protein [Caudoviricetes sp.]
MEVLTIKQVKSFLSVDGYNEDYDDRQDTDYEVSDGCGYGRGNGTGDGYGYGYGNRSGRGYGYGYGYGNGSGDGCGRGNGGVKEINGHAVYVIDNTRTIITSIHGNVAQGFILEHNTKLVPCYIAKDNNHFAHGNTLREAFTSLQEKLYDDSTEEERIHAFKRKFPSYDTKYSNQDLFVYHHVLTGSCRMGRESFANSRGISLSGKSTVREFVRLTKDAYGGDIIKKLPQAYGLSCL